ncbi:MAG: hypothetical protein HY324_03435 [Chlamydiia bacterium]|nr:hypothetical protein [Chlamydiia bacterium]
MKKFAAYFLAPFISLTAMDPSYVRTDEIADRAKIHQHGFIFDFSPTFYFPASAHRVMEISVLGDSLKLEDGSVWKISKYDAKRVLNWKPSDIVSITQNHSWFSSYKYRLVNQQTGITLEAKLFLGPIERGLNTLYITHLDPHQGYIHLTSGTGEMTRWEIALSDRNAFSKWRLGDAVIVGQNSSWDRSCESFLINVNEDAGICAQQF